MRKLPCRRRRGFTLLEVLVATTIMAVAVTGLLSALSASLRNASRLTESDRAVTMARRTMDDLLVRRDIPPGVELNSLWQAERDGLDGGWRARFELVESPPPGKVPVALERIALEVWWNSGFQRRTLQLEAFRRRPMISAPR